MWRWVQGQSNCYNVVERYISLRHVWLFATPWTVAHQTPLSMGFPRQEYWSGLPFPIPGDLPNPGIGPLFLTSPALAGRLFTTSTIWKAQLLRWTILKLYESNSNYEGLTYIREHHVYSHSNDSSGSLLLNCWLRNPVSSHVVAPSSSKSLEFPLFIHLVEKAKERQHSWGLWQVMKGAYIPLSLFFLVQTQSFGCIIGWKIQFIWQP